MLPSSASPIALSRNFLGMPNLSKKPLNEAILELRWDIPQPAQNPAGVLGAPASPYRLLVSRFFDRLSAEFPTYEALPASAVPDDMVQNVVQHRFRDKSGWPLVQIGPGLITYNETAKYDWAPFRDGAAKVVEHFYAAYPNPADLKISTVTLRYIDADSFDFTKSSVLEYLKKLKVDVTVPLDKVSQFGVSPNPEALSLRTGFTITKPKGKLALNTNVGQLEGKPAVVWETVVETAGADLPAMPQDFAKWAEEAHQVANTLFFAMIDGELREKFK